LSDSCGEQLQDFGRPEKIIIGVMLAIITAVTVMGNTLVVIAVCVVKKLRQPSNYLLVSLAVADLSVAIVVMPFVIVTDLTGGKWLFGEVFCNIFIGMDVMCCTASIMTLCVISVDRYLGITRPLTYPARQNGQLMAKMILGVWLVSASITLPPFCGWAKNVHTAGVCLISQDFGYTIYSTAVAFYIPMLVMLVMYYKIFRAAFRGLRKQTDFCMITKLMFDKAKHLFCCTLSSKHLHLNMHLSTSQINFKQRVRDTWCIVLCARMKYYLNHFFFSHTFQFGPLTKFNKSTLNVSQMFTMW
uniref:5-hydroxytryptamine (serotonin) receptor 7b n=1 Tax=Sander lucioperca TaxID=283035 RepID=A0A8D0ANK7_SANLU